MSSSQEIVISILGGKKAFPFLLDSRASYITVARTGLTKRNFQHLLAYTQIDLTTLAQALTITPRTIQRKKTTEKFSAASSEKMLSIADLYARGFEVFGDNDKFKRWMNTENKGLGGQTPISLVDTSYGLELIEDLLGRIEYGVFS